MKRLLKRLHTAQTRGQSLVEMAIIAPILLFFLLGIFEVGWALRNYLVLVNVNREITRFAIRPGYMDFSNEAARNASYQAVKVWAEDVASDQINLDFNETTGKSTLIISHMVIDTGLPCEDMDTCECDWFDSDPDNSNYHPENAFTPDDIIIHPGLENYSYQAIRIGMPEDARGEEITSRINYDYWTTRLTDENNKFNCDVIKKGGIPSANNVVFTELFHEQNQLFGFPIISNPFTDPLPLYTHTTMRLVSGARAGASGESLTANIDTIGEVCFAYPFIVSQQQLDDIDNVPPGLQEGVTVIDILDGPGSGPGAQHKGWIVWQNGFTEDDLTYELRFPQMSVNSYVNPVDTSDTVLNPTDDVASLGGGSHMSNQIKELIAGLQGQTIIVPVWSAFNSSPDRYTVSRFIEVTVGNLTDPDAITPNGPIVNATYVREAPPPCN